MKPIALNNIIHICNRIGLLFPEFRISAISMIDCSELFKHLVEKLNRIILLAK